MSDDQTVESMRVMANVNELLARQGTTFVNNFASFPLCCPSRTTFITGQYGHNHTIMGNAPPAGGYEKLVPTQANTLPAWLQRAGYTTVHLGKYLNGYGAQRPLEIPPGWSEWYGSTDPQTYRYYNYRLNENGRLVTYGTGAANYQTDVYGRKAVELIRRLAPSEKPFFLSVAFLAPHSGGPRDADDPANQATPSPAPRHRNAFVSQPLPAPPSLNEADVSDKPAAIRNRPLIRPARLNAIRENYQQRLESLLAVDEAVRDIVSALSATGELERTLIVYTSDNGFFHGEHRIPDGKVLVYEPSVRVPLDPPWPGSAARRSADEPRRERRSRCDDSRRGERVAGAAARRPLAASVRRGLAAPVRSGHPPGDPHATARSARRATSSSSTRPASRSSMTSSADPFQLTSLHADPRYAALKSELGLRLARLRVCVGDKCRQGPNLRLRAAYRHGRGGCVRSKVALRVGGGATSQVASVAFYRGRGVVKRDARAPFTAVVRRAGIGVQPTLLRAVVTLKDARSVSLERTLRRCG